MANKDFRVKDFNLVTNGNKPAGTTFPIKAVLENNGDDPIAVGEATAKIKITCPFAANPNTVEVAADPNFQSDDLELGDIYELPRPARGTPTQEDQYIEVSNDEEIPAHETAEFTMDITALHNGASDFTITSAQDGDENTANNTKSFRVMVSSEVR